MFYLRPLVDLVAGVFATIATLDPVSNDKEVWKEKDGGDEREGGGGIKILRSRSSCQIVCNISTPPVFLYTVS